MVVGGERASGGLYTPPHPPPFLHVSVMHYMYMCVYSNLSIGLCACVSACTGVRVCLCVCVCVCVYVRAPYFFQYCMMMYLLPVQKLARIWHPISNIFLDIFNKTARFEYTSCKEIYIQTLLQFLSCQFQMYRTF